MTIFGMITTRASAHYTPLALSSLVATTPLGPKDRLILIDNDRSISLEVIEGNLVDVPLQSLLATNGEGVSKEAPECRVTLLKQEAPRGFAQNANVLRHEALVAGTDLLLLNNDVVFTEGWYSAVAGAPSDTIVVPLSNREQQYTLQYPDGAAYSIGMLMALEDYRRFPEGLTVAVGRHCERFAAEPPLLNVLVAPFYVVRIPLSVLADVGAFDEGFGAGGGEDYDYCFRAILKDYQVAYATHAFLLHFGGKSTHDGPEDRIARMKREETFRKRFCEKWGPALEYLIFNDQAMDAFARSHPELVTDHKRFLRYCRELEAPYFVAS